MITWCRILYLEYSGRGRPHRPEPEPLAPSRVIAPQPPNPALPSPRLPQELIDLIFKHLELPERPDDYEACLEVESEQRRLGTRIECVCKAWQLAGRRIAWSRVSCTQGDDDYIFKGLLTRPQLVKEICALCSEPASPSADPQSASTDLQAVELIEGCSSRLKYLAFGLAQNNPALWERVSSSTMAPTLRELDVRTWIDSEEGLLSLMRGLAKFNSVAGLHLPIIDCTTWDSSAAFADVERPPILGHLPVETFVLSHKPWEERAGTLLASKLLIPLFNKGALRTIRLDLSKPEIDNLAWVGDFCGLESLTLASTSGRLLATEFVYFIYVIASVTSLKEARIDPEPGVVEDGAALARAPVSLDDLLTLVRPSVEYLRIGGGFVFIDDKLERAYAPREHPPCPSTALDAFVKLKYENEADSIPLDRRIGPDGTQAWWIYSTAVYIPADEDWETVHSEDDN
ncbi:hypothetical protein JCM8208_003580 [Rhodotorula glutinis]